MTTLTKPPASAAKAIARPAAAILGPKLRIFTLQSSASPEPGIASAADTHISARIPAQSLKALHRPAQWALGQTR